MGKVQMNGRWQVAVRCCILVLFFFCTSSAERYDRSQRGKTMTSQKELLEHCTYLIPDGEWRDLNWQAAAVVEDDERILRHLSFSSGAYVSQKSHTRVPSAEQTASFNARFISRATYKDMYFVHGSLSFTDKSVEFNLVKDGKRYIGPVRMNIDLQGLYSNRQGEEQFCSKFCAGTCFGEPAQAMFANFHMISSVTPAQFMFRTDHLDSGSFPESLHNADDLVHIDLLYSTTRSIETPFVHGIMKSLRSADEESYFYPINIVGVCQGGYEYSDSVFSKAKKLADAAEMDISPKKNVNVWSSRPLFCPGEHEARMRLSSRNSAAFSALWNSSCVSKEGNRCTPFPKLTDDVVKSVGFSSTLMQMENIQCSPDWKIRADFNFWDPRLLPLLNPPAYFPPANPLTDFLLVGEGYWNFYKPGQLVMLAYYFASNGTLVDTRIQITLQFPLARSIHHRYTVVGHVRSLRDASDALHFNSFAFVSTEELEVTEGRLPNGHVSLDSSDTETARTVYQLKYHYDNSIKAIIEPVCRLAAVTPLLTQQHDKLQHVRFPDGSNFYDLKVVFTVNSSDSAAGFDGFLDPFTIDQEFVNHLMLVNVEEVGESQSLSPVDIPVSFEATGRLNFLGPAEGWYNKETGQLCMLGCRRRERFVAAQLAGAYEEGHEEDGTQTESCDVVYSVQYPPKNPSLWAKGPFTTGHVSTLYEPGHPLYFKPVFINATDRTFYHSQVESSVLRRNLETIFNLCSESLATLVIALQVGHSSRQSRFKDLRYVSLVMLLVLTSGHFIPLLTNFSTTWNKRVPVARSLSMIAESPWWDAQEIIIRGTSIVALLLEFRLIQLVWKSRAQAAPSSETSRSAKAPKEVTDVWVFFTCLLLYIAGTAVVGYVHQQQSHWPHNSTMVWADVQGLSGVILDLFLLPQVIANVLWKTGPKIAPLFPLFYIGMTIVRSAPHLFDAWRASMFIPELYSNYYYANPNWDLYTNTWDKIIPCGSLLLAVVLFLQQWCGGRCCFGKRTKRREFKRIASRDLL